MVPLNDHPNQHFNRENQRSREYSHVLKYKTHTTMTNLITLEDKETIFLGDFNVDLMRNETHFKYLK